MNSLDRHLRHPDEHDGLPFHPDCPVCQHRLAGTLPRESVVSRQAQAALAAGVLAVSAAAPTPTVAQSSPTAGQTAPTPALPADPTLDPDWQPPGQEGLSAPELPDQSLPSGDDGQGGTGEEEPGAVESEPLLDTTPEPQGIETPLPTSAPVEQPATPSPPPAASPPVEQPAQPPVEQPPQTEEPAQERELTQQREAAKKRTGRPRQRAHDLLRTRAATPSLPASEPAPAPAPAATVTLEAPAPDTAPASQPALDRRAPVKGKAYTVRPGDSLWSIAARLLGRGASTAEIAREVNRLWGINHERIATGDPDLLAVGTVLRLR
jgi:resuscitation-promoting factor RpfA